MKKVYIIQRIIMCFCLCSVANADVWIDEEPPDPEQEFREMIGNLKEAVRRRDRAVIATFFRYPFQVRMHPLKPIANEKEMIERFDEVFDEILMNRIVTSCFDEGCKDNWSKMGDKGWMMGSGDIWVSRHWQTGACQIITVNYRTEYAKQLQTDLIQMSKEHLHPSVRNFELPVLQWEVDAYRFRIDKTAEWKYQMVLWRNTQVSTDTPELILQNGTWTPDGNGGNHHYTFQDGELTYEFHVSVVGKSEDDIGYVIIRKGDEVLLNQWATKQVGGD